jgi:hypothetical protein
MLELRADLVRSTWIIYQKSYILVIHRIDSIHFRPFGFIAPKTLALDEQAVEITIPTPVSPNERQTYL